MAFSQFSLLIFTILKIPLYYGIILDTGFSNFPLLSFFPVRESTLWPTNVSMLRCIALADSFKLQVSAAAPAASRGTGRPWAAAATEPGQAQKPEQLSALWSTP